MRKENKYLVIIISILIASLFWSCTDDKTSVGKKHKAKKETDLSRIMKSGKLTALVDYNSINYFIYHGKPMGFKYEILQNLANDMNVKLEISVNDTPEEAFDELNNRHFDIVARNLTVTKKRSKFIDFTEPIFQTRQVLVQRKPNQWRSLSTHAIEDSLIRNQLNLGEKRIHVTKNSACYTRLVNLSDEIGKDIEIVQDSVYGVEQLISMVATGEIDFTVCDENIARVNQVYYPQLDVKTPVSFPQNQAWAVPSGSKEWLSYINNWIINFKKTDTYKDIYRKYFNAGRQGILANSDYNSNTGEKLSPYDDMIREESMAANIDWRLVAAIIYHESNFDAEAESWTGAYGLMQVTPESAGMFQVPDFRDPEANVRLGISLLTWLNNYFKAEIPDSTERIKFVLASYNVGLGHVKDAQRLAEKYDKIPIVWTDNVDFFLRNKSVAKYYNDKVVKWGYCRGEEPFSFVNNVLNTYMHYCNALEPITYVPGHTDELRPAD